jgi:hypothetical protein
MSQQLERQGFRFWCDERSRQPLLDYYTNAAPQGWSAASTQFEVALASGGALVDVSNLSSLRLDGVAYSNRDGTRLFSQTLPGSSLNNALTLDTWQDGTQQHALFVFDQAAMNILPAGAQTLQVWLMITALTIAGEQLVCGAGMMTFNDDGAFASAASPPANPGAAISLGDADARYASWAAFSGVISALGGVLPMINQSTGTPFRITIDGPDTAPTISVQPSSFVVAAVSLTAPFTGQAYLRSHSTGTVFPVCLDGPDTAPALEILPAGTSLAANSLRIDGSGNVTMQNRSTGTVFTLALSGADTAPSIVILPIA